MGKRKGPQKRAVSRKFNGKTYYFAGGSYDKTQAQKQAKQIRSRGHSARVVKGYKRDPPRKGTRYYVYEEKHGR